MKPSIDVEKFIAEVNKDAITKHVAYNLQAAIDAKNAKNHTQSSVSLGILMGMTAGLRLAGLYDLAEIPDAATGKYLAHPHPAYLSEDAPGPDATFTELTA